MTESEESLYVTGLSNGNTTKFATLSTSLHDLNPDHGTLAGNTFEEDSTDDRYVTTYFTPAPYKYTLVLYDMIDLSGDQL